MANTNIVVIDLVPRQYDANRLAQFIEAEYAGDWGQAYYVAECLCRQFVNPPRWARMLVGPCPGWRDPARRRF